jgi:hypothetical protein
MQQLCNAEASKRGIVPALEGVLDHIPSSIHLAHDRASRNFKLTCDVGTDEHGIDAEILELWHKEVIGESPKLCKLKQGDVVSRGVCDSSRSHVNQYDGENCS